MSKVKRRLDPQSWLYLGAKSDGINYNLLYIPDDFNKKEREMFDPVYMRKLFDLGY